MRTCAVTGAGLTLVEPLGFRLSDRQLKRAGLDYWLGVDVTCIQDLNVYLEETPHPFFLFSSKATRLYTDVAYPPDALLVFGSETEGIPPAILSRWSDRTLTLPMRPPCRCLNLSNAVAIVLYEAWRQNGFESIS